MVLTVLTDCDVLELLDSLSKEDILEMHKPLRDALHSYSTSTDPSASGCSSGNQPSRVQMKLKSGATTLFMPASSDDGLGIKVVTLTEGKSSSKLGLETSLSFRSASSETGSRTPRSPGTPRSSSPHSTLVNSSSSRSSSPSLAKSSTSSSGTSRTNTGSSAASTSTSTRNGSVASSIIPPGTPLKPSSAAVTDEATTSPSGSLTLFDAYGRPRAVIAASTLTAFRTALASTLLFGKRQSVHTMTVFGAGRQAYWHIHLALLLRGQEIHHLNVINRSFDRAQKLYIALAQHRNPALVDIFTAGKLRPSILTPEYGEYTRMLKEHVRGADVIMCCTPSTTPLFPHGHLTSAEGRRKARYIVAVGSYKPHMQELPVEVLQQAVKGPEEHAGHHGLHVHKRAAGEGGAVVVDSIEGAMTESGEVIRSKIGGMGIVELGELVMLKRSHWAEKKEREEAERGRRESAGTHETHEHGGHGLSHLFHHHKGSRNSSKDDVHAHDGAAASKAKDEVKVSDGGLMDWLSRGNVVYKSVGIGLMDVVVGMEIVRLAEQKGIGTTVQDF